MPTGIALTVEDAIVREWLSSGLLIDAVPDEKLFIGEVPLVNEEETAEVLPSFASIDNRGRISHERSSERSYMTDRIALTVEDERREVAAELANRTFDRFDRCDNFAWDRGTVLNMKQISYSEKQGEDGMWIVSQEFATLYTVD